MLTHTDLHYLAAILTQIASPWGVELELGEMVKDIAAEKGRDVDITVRYRLQDGTLVEMHGIEVKDEGRALDVIPVEQIIAKLKDMPSLTKHALVSASGFSEPAKKKARYHGLELYHLREWDGKGLPVDLSHTTFAVNGIQWETIKAIPIIEPPPEGAAEGAFEIPLDVMVHIPTNPDLKRKLFEHLNWVCDVVLNDDQVRNNPVLAKDKRLIVDIPVNLDPFQVTVNGKMVTISTIRIQGVAVINEHPGKQVLRALIRDEDNSLVAGCLIKEFPDGSLWILMASSTDGSLTARIISVSDRGKNKIYKEKMASIPPDGPPSLDAIVPDLLATHPVDHPD